MATLYIQLLGGFRFLYNGEPVRMVHLLRQQSLLAHLVLHRDLPQTRQQLAFLFWPEASGAQARANLRKALYELRRAMPALDQVLQIEDHFLQWRTSTALTLDVARFADRLAQAEQAKQPEVAQAALEQAVAFYTGDLLPACYDDWLLLERERLRQQYVKALEQLVSLLEEQRAFLAALDYAQRLLQCDSLHESTYRLLMRLHVLQGDRATALRIYHTCVTQLQQELGVEPSPETQQLYQRLLHVPADPALQGKSSSPAVQAMIPLVGRQPEWQTLQSAWRKAVAGTAQCILIAGEAGMGKTRLAEELLEWADRQGYATARTRSYAAEGRLAYAPITDWLRSNAIRASLPQLEPVWLVEVARLLPELLVARPDLPPPAPLTDSWQRQRFREALARALLLAHQPLLLVIDDLQWCDGETLEWLHHLLRVAAQEPLLLVGTVRAEEVGADHPLLPLLAGLRQAGQLTDVELGPLSRADTAALAGQVAGRTISQDQANHLYAQTEGHPLFVVEMLRASEISEPISQQASTPAVVALPPKVQVVIQSRLAQLSTPARELIGLAATVGRAFTIEVLTKASENDEGSLVHALDELWQRRLIRDQGGNRYDFSHDRIREAAYASVSAARRRLLHRRVGEALQQIYATDLDTISVELAAHYDHAGLSEQAMRFYQQAAGVAQRIYAHTEATSLLVKGLRMLEQLPVTTVRLQQELSLRLALATSSAVLKGNSASEVKDEYVRAQELAVQVGDNLERFAVLLGLFVCHLGQGLLKSAHDLGKQRLALAEQVGDASERADACGSLGVLHLHLGQWATARNLLEQTLDRTNIHTFYAAPLLPEQHLGLAFQRHLAFVLWHLGYPDQALAQMDETLARAQELSHSNTLAAVYAWSAWLYQCRREAPLVQMQAEKSIALCLEHRFPYWLEHSDVLLGWALAQQGHVEAGIARMDRSLAIRQTMDAHLHQPAFLGLIAEAYGQAGQPEQGLRVLNEALDAVEASGERMSVAELHRLQGEMLRIRGAAARAVEAHFLQALAVARQQEAKSLELRAALSLCRLWQHQGRPQEAHEMLAGIYGWFTEGFTTPDLMEARALLAELS